MGFADPKMFDSVQSFWRPGPDWGYSRRGRPIRLPRGHCDRQGGRDDSGPLQRDSERHLARLHRRCVDVQHAAAVSDGPRDRFDTDPFLLAAARVEEDTEIASRLSKGAFGIAHDFTQYFK